MTSSTRVLRTSIVLLVIAFVALMLIVVATLRLGDNARLSAEKALEARDTRAAATEARAAVQTAESSQRGYILTGNPIYLAPYATAKETARRELDRLARLLERDPDVQPALRRLNEVLAEKAAEMDRTIDQKRDRQDAEALALLRSNRGKALMDQANVFFSGINRTADERLTRSVNEQNESAAALRWTTILSGVLIVVVVALVTGIVFRYTRELATAREEVAGLNRGLEKRVAERTIDLARANEEIQRFAHVVSHDLRAPLVNIVGFTAEIEDGLEDLRDVIQQAGPDGRDDGRARAILGEFPEAIGFIRSSTQKMEGLIANVLKLSREGRRVLRPERVDIAELVRTSAAAMQYQLTSAGGALNLDLAVPSLVVDRLSLEQAVANLIENAAKYRSPERPLRIEVRTRPLAEGRLSLEIEDNGRGIPERDHQRVFELFARAGPATQPGEGVGLAHVRTIVRHLGGEITMSSAVDVGTTFRLELPMEPPVDLIADSAGVGGAKVGR